MDTHENVLEYLTYLFFFENITYSFYYFITVFILLLIASPAACLKVWCTYWYWCGRIACGVCAEAGFWPCLAQRAEKQGGQPLDACAVFGCGVKMFR